MKLGERLSLGTTLTDENMVFLKQLGVEGVMVAIGTVGKDVGAAAGAARLATGDYWEASDLLQLREWVEGFGLELFAIANVPFHRYDRVIRGLPGRDEQIENYCRSLRSMGAAGIPALQYNWVINAGERWSNWRTSVDTPGRGGALVASFDYDLAKDHPITEFGRVTDEEMWDNLAYFLKRVIPVAEESGVRMALHPADPQVPVLAGIARIIRDVDAYERVFDLARGDANGMALCQGCFAQMLDAERVYEAIRRFGSGNKIVLVHFRNVVGTLEKFAEAYWDEGKVDMFRAMMAYREAGFHGYLVPDHTPRGVGDTQMGHRSRAFALGYMRGLIQAVSAG